MDSADEVHAEVLGRLACTGRPFWDADAALATSIDFGVDLEAQIDITPAVHRIGRGYFSYVFRDEHYLRDTAEFDDRCIVQLTETIGSTSPIFRVFVSSFRPYRATIEFDEDLALDDWVDALDAGAISGSDEDGRDGVWRVGPISYFDDQLCIRAFGLGAEAAVARLQTSGINACRSMDGLLIDAGDGPWSRLDLIGFDAEFRDALDVEKRQKS